MHADGHVLAGEVEFIAGVLRAHGDRLTGKRAGVANPRRAPSRIRRPARLPGGPPGALRRYSGPVSDTDPKPLSALVDPGWAAALAPVEPRIHELGRMLREEIAQGRQYLPAGTDVLRAFTYPFDEVKVLIVGQDPYPTPGHAMGLSFSVAPGVAIPRSLQNIFAELETDLGLPRPSSGDLSAWSREGVCLLNRVLTVRPGAPGSHRRRGWEEVTERAIDALVHRVDEGGRRRPLVAVLWGRDAQTLEPRLEGVPIVKSPHPSPMSARYGFFGSRPFSRANALLEAQGASPVNWTL